MQKKQKIHQLGEILKQLEHIVNESSDEKIEAYRMFPTFQPSLEISESQLTIRNIFLNERQSMDEQITKNYASNEIPQISLDTIDLSPFNSINLDFLEKDLFNKLSSDLSPNIPINIIKENTAKEWIKKIDKMQDQQEQADQYHKLVELLQLLESLEQGRLECKKTNNELQKIMDSFYQELNISENKLQQLISNLLEVRRHAYFSNNKLNINWIYFNFHLVKQYQQMIILTQEKINKSINMLIEQQNI